MTESIHAIGKVFLVGAGPGDPDLITVKGRKLLEVADAVVYDALANQHLLDLVPSRCELIDAGKRAKNHKLSQDEINARLVKLARTGKLVVRLKGGDPYLFGRGAEEAVHLAQHGIAVEVVPGITSGIAGPMMAGVPVTYRGLSSSVTFVTGHEDPTKSDSALDYDALAKVILAGGTLCIYMGVGRVQMIRDALMQGGVPGNMLVLAVQWGTLPRQKQVKATLDDLPTAIEKASLAAPAIIVIGKVAGLEEPGLDFFTSRPMFGQRVVVTRTRQQASQLREQLESLGAEVLEAPTIEIAPPADLSRVDQTLLHVQDYDWLLLTSSNAVEALTERLLAIGKDARALACVKLACIGQATAEMLQLRLGIRADFVPGRAVADALAEELVGQSDLTSKRCLILQADIARPILEEKLAEHGATVETVVAYETRQAKALPAEVRQAFEQGQVDWVTFTSSSTASNLVDLLGGDVAPLKHCRLASIGPKTSATLRELGMEPTVEAEQPGIDALVQAMANFRT